MPYLSNKRDQSLSLLDHLSSNIGSDTATVSAYLRDHALPHPSHDADGPANVLPTEAPPDIQQARQHLIATAIEIAQLAAGPSEFLPHLATGIHHVSCLQWLCHHKVFHHIPLNGEASYADLSAALDIPEMRLKSIIRMAMTASLFQENTAHDRVRHSAHSALLARDENAAVYASYLCARTAPMALSMTAAHERWGPDSTARNETAYNVAFETEMPFFEDLARDQGRVDEFARYMRSVRSSETVALKHLVAGVGGKDLPAGAHLVDVGGSTGGAAIAVAKAHPHVTFTVQDVPENAEAGRQQLAADETLDQTVKSRITFQTHDFFQPQPAHAAPASFLLRMILHDWPDADAVRILRCLADALAPHTRLFIMDTVLPPVGTAPVSLERLARARDLTMLQAFNSKERELEDWRALVAAAGLEIEEVRQPVGSVMSILVCRSGTAQLAEIV